MSLHTLLGRVPPDRPAPSGASPRGLARDPVLRGLFVVLVVILVVHVGRLGDLDLRARLFWVEQVLLDVGYGLLIWRLARLPEHVQGGRRFWRRFTVVAALCAAGDLAQAWVSITGPGADAVGGSTPQTVLVGGGVLLAMWAMLVHPVAVSGRERLRLWLDAATIMTGAAVFAWNFTLLGGPRPPAEVMVTLVGAALMLLAGYGVVKLLLGNNSPFSRLVGGLSAASSVGVGLSTGLASAADTPAELDFSMVVRLMPCVLMAAAPRIQELQLRADPAGLTRRRRSYNLMPYVVAALTAALLVVVLLDRNLGTRVWGVVAGVVAMTACVVIRQLAAFTENDALLLRLRRQEERFRSMVQHASDVTMVTDATGAITYASPAIERVLGVAADRALGQPLLALVHPDDLPAAERMLEELNAAPRTTAGVRLRARRADGSWRWLATICTNLFDDPSVNGIICNARDVTDEQQLEDRLRFDATHDPLTHLANRTLLQERIDAESADRRDADRPVAMLAIDLDDFKPVNDSLGHHVGDSLLVSVAGRLLSCARPGDTVARTGGDEFAVLLTPASATDATAVAERILGVLAQPAAVEGHWLTVHASIGVATGPARDAGSLLRAADVAMYEAKQGGKGTVAVAGLRDRQTGTESRLVPHRRG